VLSACDVGLGAGVGTDELLGLVTALLALGSVGVLASVLPVADDAVAELSVLVHERLVAGASLSDALLAAREDAGLDPLAAATASAFLAFGAG
jgi:CHAT domain-containing protein